VKRRNRELTRRGHLDPVHRQSRATCELVSAAQQVANVSVLLRAHLIGPVPRVLATVVGANGFGRTIRRGPVKEQNEVLDAVRFDEEMTFAT